MNQRRPVTGNDAPASEAGTLTDRVDRVHPVSHLWWFFGLAFAITWITWWPVAFDIVPDAAELPLLGVGVFGPILAAAIVVKFTGGSWRQWLQIGVRPRPARRWLLVPFALALVVLGLSTVTGLALGHDLELPDLADDGTPIELPLVYLINLVFLILWGGGQEEPGWRGFALPRLLERLGATSASLVLGAAWAAWHLPLFAMDDTNQAGTGFAPYAIGTLGLSILFTWLHLETHGSVIIAALFHGVVNANSLLDPIADPSTAQQWAEAGVLVAVATLFIAIHGINLQRHTDTASGARP